MCKIFSFEIEKKADVVSVVALLLSLIAAGASVWGYLRGASPSLVPPTDVSVFEQSRYSTVPKPFTEFVLPLIAYNDGMADSALLMKSVSLVVKYGDSQMTYDPALFGRMPERPASDCKAEDIHACLKNFTIYNDGGFHPLVLRTDDIVQKAIVFVPHYDESCDQQDCLFKDFLWSETVLSDLKTNQSKDIELLFSFEYENESLYSRMFGSHKLKCTVKSQELKQVFQTQRWITASRCSTE